MSMTFCGAAADMGDSPAAEELLRFDHLFRDLRQADAALLAFELKAAVGGGLVEVHALHQHALGALDELAGLQRLRERLLLLREHLLLPASGRGNLALRGQPLAPPRFDQVPEDPRLAGAADELGI